MVGHEDRNLGDLDCDIRPINNRVIVRIDFDPEEDKTEAGIYKGSGRWDEVGHLVRYGEVVAVCNKLYEREVDKFGVEWGTTIEIEVGDTVYFTKMESYNCPLFRKDGVSYFAVDYAELILRIRDDEYYPLNGYVIVKKVEEQNIRKGLILDFSKHHNKKKGIVKWVGNPLRYYFPVSRGLVEATDINEGDSVVFSLAGFTSLEDPRYAKLDTDLGYLQRRWIVAKIGTNN